MKDEGVIHVALRRPETMKKMLDAITFKKMNLALLTPEG
jgi:hypothetical protein